jgi:hypothetical protein
MKRRAVHSWNTKIYTYADDLTYNVLFNIALSTFCSMKTIYHGFVSKVNQKVCKEKNK